MVIFKTKGTIMKIGNGFGIRFPNHSNMKFEENDKVLVEVTDENKIIITPIKNTSNNNYTDDKFNRLRKYRSI